MKEKLNLLIKKTVTVKTAWNYNRYWNVGVIISSKVRSPKMLPKKDGLKVSELSPCLFIATEIANVFFRLSYFDQF